MADELNIKQNQGERNEFIIKSDDYGETQSFNDDSGSKKDTGRKNLKIMIPQVTYKYIKDAMFPDSKVKDEKFLKSPYPNPEFGNLSSDCRREILQREC